MPLLTHPQKATAQAQTATSGGTHMVTAADRIASHCGDAAQHGASTPPHRAAWSPRRSILPFGHPVAAYNFPLSLTSSLITRHSLTPTLALSRTTNLTLNNNLNEHEQSRPAPATSPKHTCNQTHQPTRPHHDPRGRRRHDRVHVRPDAARCALCTRAQAAQAREGVAAALRRHPGQLSRNRSGL